jgi:DNA-binding transcriptional regulator YhcF (GntR family)
MSWKSWGMVFDEQIPIYRQVILQFRQAFVRGDIGPGERIPSIRELSALLKVNTNTIQHAYQEMERDDLISGKRGTGYFFTEDSGMIIKTRRDLARDSLNCFVEEMRALGCADREIIDELESYLVGGKQNAAGS